jgi:hypothetical protein
MSGRGSRPTIASGQLEHLNDDVRGGVIGAERSTAEAETWRRDGLRAPVRLLFFDGPLGGRQRLEPRIRDRFAAFDR